MYEASGPERIGHAGRADVKNLGEWNVRDARDHFVYVIGRLNEATCEIEGPTKIGLSQSPLQRLKQLQSEETVRLILVAKFAFWQRRHARIVERAFHATRDDFRTRGEWFDIPPADAVALMATTIQAFVERFLGADELADFWSAYDHLSLPGFAYSEFPRDQFEHYVWE